MNSIQEDFLHLLIIAVGAEEIELRIEAAVIYFGGVLAMRLVSIIIEFFSLFSVQPLIVAPVIFLGGEFTSEVMDRLIKHGADAIIEQTFEAAVDERMSRQILAEFVLQKFLGLFGSHLISVARDNVSKRIKSFLNLSHLISRFEAKFTDSIAIQKTHCGLVACILQVNAQ